MELIDFTPCKIDKAANYGGSDKKRGIIYNGQRYMLKLSDKIPNEKRLDINSSYSNSSYSEYIGCHILESMDFDVQETLLGTLQMLSSKGEVKIYPTVACKNFVPDGCTLVEFKFIESVLLDSKPPKIPTIRDIYQILTNQNEYFDKEFGKDALKQYWDLFIADAFLGNFDRHANNWGYLIENKTGQIKLAPIYDCGSCLYPQMADDAMEDILNNPAEIQMRIDKFPNAALTFDNGEKVSYRKYISSFINPDCTAALMRIAPKINMNKINQIIDDTPDISDIRKTFYKTMLNERYKQIIFEPYKEHLKSLENNNPKCMPKCSSCPETCIRFGTKNIANLKSIEQERE